MLVYLDWACGSCRPCLEGRDDVCTAAGRVGTPPADAGLTPMHVEVTHDELADGVRAFDDLEAGTIRGRAVLVP